MCFQELFYGPYFCQVQDAAFYEYAEAIPDGPTTQRFQSVAKELGMVMVLPMYEMEQEGVLYNTAAVIDADGTYLGKYRKTHIPQVKGFWEKFYFRPGNLGYPCSTPRSAASASTSATTATSRGLAGARPRRGEDRVQPVGHQPRASSHLWQLEQTASAVANEYFVGAINRVGRGAVGRQRLLRPDVLRPRRAGSSWATWPAPTTRSSWCGTSTWIC
jgi:beta-ureidopropionase